MLVISNLFLLLVLLLVSDITTSFQKFVTKFSICELSIIEKFSVLKLFHLPHPSFTKFLGFLSVEYILLLGVCDGFMNTPVYFLIVGISFMNFLLKLLTNSLT